MNQAAFFAPFGTSHPQSTMKHLSLIPSKRREKVQRASILGAAGRARYDVL